MVSQVKRYSDEAIVLRSYKLAEADRIVVLLTKNNGKVRAVAKGVRKMKSRFGSKLEPFNHLTAQIHRGRGDLDFIVEVESISQFPIIRSSLSRLDSAYCFLEIIDRVSLEARPAPRLFEMLLGALNVLEKSDVKSDSPILVPAFYLKVLAKEGFAPVLDICVVCGKNSQLTRFDFEEGGMCCLGCGRTGVKVSPKAHSLLQMVLEGELNQALSEPVSQKVSEEVAKLATRYLEYRLELKLRTN